MTFEVEEDKINFKEQRPGVLPKKEQPLKNRFTLETLDNVMKNIHAEKTTKIDEFLICEEMIKR